MRTRSDRPNLPDACHFLESSPTVFEVSGQTSNTESSVDLCFSALADLAEAMLDSDAPASAFHRVVTRLAGITSGTHASFVMLNQGSATEGTLAASTLSDATLGVPVDLSAWPSRERVLRDGQTTLILGLIQGVGLGEPPAPSAGASVSTTMIPVFLERRVEGVLLVRHDGPEAAKLTPDRLRFGQSIASMAGIGVRSHRLHTWIRDSSEARRSDRLKAERRIQQIERYQRFFDFAGDGLIIVDGRGHILFANRAAQSSLGFLPPAITRVALSDIVAPEGHEALDVLLVGIRRGRYHRDLEVPIIRSSGEQALLSVTSASLDDTTASEQQAANPRLRPADSVAIVSFRDVTATRHLEQALRQAQRKLELNERQTAIVELAGAAAHELNQPLTSIIGTLELLGRKMAPDDPHRRPIELLLAEADRMAEIVRKFGQISRYETKPYLGATDIVDLDRAARSGSSGGHEPGQA
ncbi:MAG: PAS domain S-box protein [Deltaproteobacteria bacterium]|nr:PAS domain S-box protein [Deltaproteobacteria bacterium]